METAQIYERVKERVRERLRTTERHRWLGKDGDGGGEGTKHIKCNVSHVFISISRHPSCLLSAPHSIWAFWNEQKYAINYLHQKFNICGSVWLTSFFYLGTMCFNKSLCSNTLCLGHYCQLLCAIVSYTHLHGISDPHLNLWDCKIAKCVVIIGKGSMCICY